MHYQHPQYRRGLALLLDHHPEAKRLDAYAEVFCGPFGTEIREEDYRTDGVPLLRISNITKEGVIDLSDLVFLSEQKAGSLVGTQVAPGDLVISQRGTIGAPAIVPNVYPKWNISANLIGIRSFREVSPSFVQVFLSSTLGQTQIERTQSGQVQGKITTEDVASVLIPRMARERALVLDLDDARRAREGMLAEAEALLAGMDAFVLQALGIALPPPGTRSTVAIRAGQGRAAGRLNADYYHPERLMALQALERSSATNDVTELRQLVEFRRDQASATSTARYIGLAHVQSHTGELVEADEQAEGSAFAFREGDVLFARLGPYLNKVHRAETSGVCSTEFYVLRVLPDVTLAPDYLAAVLRSSLVLARTRHMMSGNTHPRLTSDDVVHLRIPVPRDDKAQEAIAAEVRRRQTEARRLRAEAERIWSEAKAEFERRILEEA